MPFIVAPFIRQNGVGRGRTFQQDRRLAPLWGDCHSGV